MNPQKLKVLFVSGGNHPGFSIAPFIKSQAEALMEAGVSVDFFRITRKGLRGYLSHIRPLRKVIREGQYDLVHAHYTFCGWVARLANSRIPLVVSYMGSDTYGSVNSSGRRKLKSIPVVLQGMLLNFFVDAIIVKSKNLRKMILRKSIASVIPNGVDFKAFMPMEKEIALQKLGLSDNTRYVLFMGNPADPRKNFSLAFKACQLAEKQVKFRLLSPYPVKPEDVPLYLNAADLLLVTSWLEGSPNIVKEAMACNCPIIATPSGDIAEVLGQTKQCYLLPFDAEMLAKGISEVLSAAGRSNGRELMQHLDNTVVARQIIELYKRLKINE
ncbi:MAG TPA: glycosyltransferase family 4 protein [Bacteroidales bacterium]|nr:glycosyltransferase family 4 protein [Bacteroidales bacterium]HRZ49949.1 glycosyltransferase family 4 protein [Bacteroidales bacterium]